MTRPDVSAAIEKWNAQTRDEFEERAAIIEFDGKVPRDNAELMAYQQIMRATRPKTSGSPSTAIPSSTPDTQ